MKISNLCNVDRTTKVAIAAGALCCLCVFLYMFALKSESEAYEKEISERYGVDQVDVVVAKRDIAGGETISDVDVEVKSRASSDLPQNAVFAKADCIGKQLGSGILAGEVVSSARFQAQSLTLDVPTGKDAICIPLDDASSVGGALNVGQKVDIYATGTSTTEKICSSVEILETSNSAYESEAETKWITVAISKDKSQEVVAAAQRLELYVTLPSSTNKEE